MTTGIGTRNKLLHIFHFGTIDGSCEYVSRIGFLITDHTSLHGEENNT